MLGLLVEIIISWLLLWLFGRRNLSALGIMPTKSRLADLCFGFLMAAICCTLYYFSFTVLAGTQWTLNEAFTARAFAASAGWALNSVLYEELIFRGALLYIAIHYLHKKRACLLSAIAFGIYHWFSYGLFGNPVQMTFVFLMTGIWGFMFAMSFAKTKSLYLPIGLHFGWNVMSMVVFSLGAATPQLLIGTGGEKLTGLLSLTVFLFQVFAVPLMVWWYLSSIRSDPARS